MIDRSACLKRWRASSAFAEPEDVQYFLSRTRLPTERAITEQVRSFKNLSMHTEITKRSRHV
jgi:hypothetical protein